MTEKDLSDSNAPATAKPPTAGTPQTGTGGVPLTTAQHRVIASRRPDVLFRVRREEGQEVSAWWMIGAFVLVSAGVIILLSFVPGSA